MSGFEIKVSEDLKGYGIDVAASVVEDINVRKSSKDFDDFWEEKIKKVSEKYDLETLKDVDVIRKYRSFFWRIGIDPTKIRPSSEALVRRVLAGNVPRINMAVDCYNLASIETLIAMGAYDLDRTRGKLVVRFSDGEKFVGIGNKVMVTKDQIVMSDEKNVLSIYPYRDSDFSKITGDTSRLVIVACGVEGIERERLEKAAMQASTYIKKFCI